METVSYDWRKSVRQFDPQTSVDAARSIKRAANTQHVLIVDVLKRSGVALAAEQIEERLPGHPGIWRRMVELERAGHIIKTPELHTNRSGRKAARYIAA